MDRYESSSDEEGDDAFFCPVCFIDEEDEAALEITATQCGHAFCKRCFDKLQSANMSCAMCRSPLIEKSMTAVTTTTDQSPTPLSLALTNTNHVSDYSVSIVEKEIHLGRIRIRDCEGRVRKKRNIYCVYDIVSYHHEQHNLIYERHVSIPIGGTEPAPEHILALLQNAQRITYESNIAFLVNGKANDTLGICKRFRRMLHHYRKKFQCKTNSPLPSLPWQAYRFMDFVNHVYSPQVPNVPPLIV